MKVGTIFKWNNFPYPQFGSRKKLRWFIYLGDSGPFFEPVRSYLHTTTTTLMPSEPCFFFDAKKCDFFEQDCRLYYNEKPYTFNKSELQNNRDVEIVDRLSEGIMKILYEGIRKSNKYTKMEKLDIHTSFNMDGITGLKKP